MHGGVGGGAAFLWAAQTMMAAFPVSNLIFVCESIQTMVHGDLAVCLTLPILIWASFLVFVVWRVTVMEQFYVFSSGISFWHERTFSVCFCMYVIIPDCAVIMYMPFSLWTNFIQVIYFHSVSLLLLFPVWPNVLWTTCCKTGHDVSSAT